MKSDKIMKPLWLEYPDVSRFEIFWRMGGGEDYAYKLHNWYEELSAEDKAEYRELFPEPAEWRGCWDDYYNENEYFIFSDNFSVLRWDGDGTPKYNKAELKEQFSKEKKEIISFPKYTPEKLSNEQRHLLYQYTPEKVSKYYRYLLCPDGWGTAVECMTFLYDTILEFLAAGEAAFEKENRKDEWEKWKYTSALNAIWQVYGYYTDNNYLLDTGDSILVMTDPDDKVWGAGLAEDDPDLADPAKWPGENLYGFALMEVRDEIRRIWKNVGLCTE